MRLGLRAVTPFLLAALVLAGCGDAKDSDVAAGPSITTESGITVTGDPGTKPSVEVPKGDPPSELIVEVLNEGDGPEVQSGDLLAVQYLGQTWKPTKDSDPNVFDNSYDRGEPFTFTVGKGAVIQGWDEGVLGQPMGSRLALTIPPGMAYQDREQGTIPPNSTLVFVVELERVIPTGEGISGTPVTDLPAGLPSVSGGSATEAPSVSFDGTQPPTESASTVLIAGDGDALGKNLVVRILQVTWGTGEVEYSSWEQGSPETISAGDLPGLAEALGSDAKVGTRVLTVVSAADNPQTQQPLALVVDIIGTY